MFFINIKVYVCTIVIDNKKHVGNGFFYRFYNLIKF